MNIRAKEGHKVVFLGKGGYDIEPVNAIKDGLEVGKEYTVDFTDVGQSHSTVHLKEFPDRGYNTVMFDDAGADFFICYNCQSDIREVGFQTEATAEGKWNKETEKFELTYTLADYSNTDQYCNKCGNPIGFTRDVMKEIISE
jgi:hypothetical protein